MKLPEAIVAVGGMVLIGFVCWVAHSATPLWGLLLLAIVLGGM